MEVDTVPIIVNGKRLDDLIEERARFGSLESDSGGEPDKKSKRR